MFRERFVSVSAQWTAEQEVATARPMGAFVTRNFNRNSAHEEHLSASDGGKQIMMVNSVRLNLAACTLFLVSQGGCATGRAGAISPGAAKKYIQKNVTTQAEMIEIFGTPNVITRRDGYEMWVYDKISSRVTNAALGLGGFGGGVGSGGGGGGFLSGGVASAERSETTVMLIVYYDENDTVTDYKVTQTKF